MKVNVISDLHLEFEDLVLPDGDVLILSGDVCEAKHLKEGIYNPNYKAFDFEDKKRPDRWNRFFEEECRKYRKVVYVVGNHEHYGFQFEKTVPHIKSNLPDNVHLLDNDIVDIDDVRFVGGTLWTDMNKGDYLTLYHVQRMMNDYRQITMFNRVKSVYHRLTPERTIEEHKKTLDYIKTVVDEDNTKKYVVVTHHAPSKSSIHPRYQKDVTMNGAYSSELSEFILDRPQIKMWTHGHTHDTFDYMIGSTRIVCNPRGYKYYEQRAEEFDPTLSFEV
jgi:Icc-related predicted phosphoesterase